MNQSWMERLAELAHVNQQMKDDVEKDTFLREWLDEINQYKPIFDAKNKALSASERESDALAKGYRTWRQYIDAVDGSNRLYYLYVHGEAFQRLWHVLKDCDKSSGFVDLYGPHNGGAPLRLSRAFSEWYSLPKFTKAERSQHCEKIKRLCDELLLLVGQITPVGEADDPFRFARISYEQAQHLLAAFKSPDSLIGDGASREAWTIRRTAQMALERGGITAAWCVQNIRDAASIEPLLSPTPTKIRAKSAFKTYLILNLNRIVWSAFTEIPGRQQLIADVVVELANMDCTAEDVRKAIANIEPEDFGTKT